MMMLKDERLISGWLILVILLFCTFFVHNQAIFVDIMESRNLVTAREMVSDGNWLIPTMNGELRLEKPPLPTWIAAMVETVSPDNLMLQRSMAGLAAVLLVSFTSLLAYRLTQKKLYAFLTAVLLCTSYSLILMGRTVSWDIYCHAFMMVAIYFLFRALQADRCIMWYFTWAGLALGASFLGKGPVSFYALLLPFGVAYGLYYRKSLAGKWKGIAWMFILTLAVSAWWYIYIYISHPELSEFVFKKESSSWVNYNVRPWYYYWKFFLESGVWSLLTLLALCVPLWKKRIKDKRSYLFSVIWILSFLFFLSLVPEKKSRYLLPILIPCALAGAHVFYYWICEITRKDTLGRTIYRVHSLLIAAIVLSIPYAIYHFAYKGEVIGRQECIWLSVGTWFWGVMMAMNSFKFRPCRFLLCVAGLFMFIEVFMMPHIGGFVANKQKKSIYETRSMAALQPLPFYYPATDTLRIELVYEANKKIKAIDLGDTMAVKAALPFVLLSSKEQIPEENKWKSIVDITKVGRYDDNPWSKGHRRYKEYFIKYVTVWRLK